MALSERLRAFEEKYKMRSLLFYEGYLKGHLDQKTPQFIKWKKLYEALLSLVFSELPKRTCGCGSSWQFIKKDGTKLWFRCEGCETIKSLRL